VLTSFVLRAAPSSWLTGWPRCFTVTGHSEPEDRRLAPGAPTCRPADLPTCRPADLLAGAGDTPAATGVVAAVRDAEPRNG
jgi:hypothetical protein